PHNLLEKRLMIRLNGRTFSTRVGLYAGSFDPPHIGHLDIITRSRLKLCDRLYVLVSVNPLKKPAMPTERRIMLLKKAT
ncbi:MAG: adenylyltransferase/cytidyltransferase family protein, partial [bacterium]